MEKFLTVFSIYYFTTTIITTIVIIVLLHSEKKPAEKRRSDIREFKITPYFKERDFKDKEEQFYHTEGGGLIKDGNNKEL